jgi:ATP-dependent exoDNAse (exonuclease V) alpha subunit
MAPTLLALSFANVAHAQGTMDFSGAQTLMGTFKTVSFDANQMRHFDHGYAVTSHSSQGLTAERVMVNLDSHVHADLINKRFAYVAVSRGSHDAHIYTDSAASLISKLSHDVVKSSALENSFVNAAATTTNTSGGLEL